MCYFTLGVFLGGLLIVYVVYKRLKAFYVTNRDPISKIKGSKGIMGSGSNRPQMSFRAEQGREKTVYLLDPEVSKWTEIFKDKFECFVDPQIKFERVKTCSDCIKDYPIALLSIRQTDRPLEDIESILEHLKEEFYQRTVLIYIHVRYKKSFLPRIPTKVKTSEFDNGLCDILDFGLVNKSIEACFYDEKLDTRGVFHTFVEQYDYSTPD